MCGIPHDPFDVVTVLEVETQFDEDAFCEFYVVTREGLTLDVAIFLAEPRAEISLRREGDANPLLHFSFWGSQIRRVGDGRGELLEFSDCILGNIALHPDELPFSSKAPLVSVRLWIKPGIRVQIV